MNPPDQAAQELRRKINLTVMSNYPGTTASDQFIDDLLALMYRENLAVIGEDGPEEGNMDDGTPTRDVVEFWRNILRAEQRQAAAKRYRQEGGDDE